MESSTRPAWYARSPSALRPVASAVRTAGVELAVATGALSRSVGVEHRARVRADRLEGVEVVELALAVDGEDGPQRALAAGRHLVAADERLAHVHEDAGAALGERGALQGAPVGVVVHREEVRLAEDLPLDGDGLGPGAVGVVDVEVRGVAQLALEEDVVAHVDGVQVEVRGRGAPGEHHAQAVEVVHHRAQRVRHALAGALGDQRRVPGLLDDEQHALVGVREAGRHRGHAVGVGGGVDGLGAVLLHDDLGAVDALVLHHRAEHLDLHGFAGEGVKREEGEEQGGTHEGLPD